MHSYLKSIGFSNLVRKTDIDIILQDVIRHYDVTGKKCPLYYVEHEDEWKKFKEEVDAYIEKNGVLPSESEKNSQ